MPISVSSNNAMPIIERRELSLGEIPSLDLSESIVPLTWLRAVTGY